jgi:sporulation protein YlmC with PRC-barrel domain
MLAFSLLAVAADGIADGPKTPTGKVGAAKSFRASQLIGLAVKNSENDTLGSVEDIVMDVESGKVAYVALSFGGVLGIGDKLFAVPYRQLEFMHGQEEMYFVLKVPKDRLKTAPGFDKNKWPNFADPAWTKSINSYYGENLQ